MVVIVVESSSDGWSDDDCVRGVKWFTDCLVAVSNGMW
jgi:hypothetical protein